MYQFSVENNRKYNKDWYIYIELFHILYLNYNFSSPANHLGQSSERRPKTLILTVYR